MSLELVIAMSFVTVAAALVTLLRTKGWTWILQHTLFVDLGFTAMCLLAFSGNGITGMLIAILAGLVMTVLLTVCRRMQMSVDTLVKPRSVDDEYDAEGNWIYNQAPYV